MKSGFIHTLLAIIVAVGAIAGIGFIMINKGITSKTTSDGALPLQETKLQAVFPKRAITEVSGWQYGKAYPDEIRKLADQNLIGFQCGIMYHYVDSAFVGTSLPLQENGSLTQHKLDNETLITLVTEKYKEQQSTNSRTELGTIQTCNTEENKQLVIYSFSKGGGGAGVDTFITYLTRENSFSTVSMIPAGDAAYFACSRVLALTTNNKIYMECGGGDGGSGSASIHKVDLVAGTNTVLIDCMSGFNGIEPYTTCK